MIEFKDVTKTYGDVTAIEHLDLKIEEGEFVFLVGPSGAGKSTCIKLLLKEVEADEGEIIINDMDVTDLPNRLIPVLRRSIGIVFQDFRLLSKKTVYENVAFAMHIVNAPRKAIKEQVPQVLELVGIADKAKMYPDQLSAGQQQRVAIARAIVNKPSILIADEPTGNLDPDTAWEIMDILETINKRGTTVVMVTHAKDIVDRMGKRVISIQSGKMVRDVESGEYGSLNIEKKKSSVFWTRTMDDLTGALDGQQNDEDKAESKEDLKPLEDVFISDSNEAGRSEENRGEGPEVVQQETEINESGNDEPAAAETEAVAEADTENSDDKEGQE